MSVVDAVLAMVCSEGKSRRDVVVGETVVSTDSANRYADIVWDGLDVL